MPNSSLLTVNRRFRMPLAIAGPAVLGLSMLLSVGPALGAANNGDGSNGNTHGTSGNLKVHDAGTGVETAGTDNEPHVCAFWLSFTLEAPYEAGTWVVVSWAPTGDGSTVVSGVYDTVGDGVDNSGVIVLPAGHYRVEWAGTGATNSKKKTFWVDGDCGQAPSEDASQPEDVTPPSDAPGSPDEESQPEELVLDNQVTAPQEDEAPADEAPATDEEDLASDEEDVASVEEPGGENATSPEGDSAQDPGTPPAQDELGSIGAPDGPTMSDTATSRRPAEGGPIAGLALLLLIGVHVAIRRDRLIPSTHN